MSLLRPNYIHCALVLSLVAVFGLYYYWCDPLWKLSGQMVPLLDLESRGFTIKPWGELPSQLLRRVPKLEEARAKIGYNVSKASLDADVFSRGRFQSLQVQRFCSASNISPLLPLNPLELKELFKHLLYDDSKRLVFCYVPKNGCSNIKRMMLVLDGVLPPESVNGSRPNEQILDQVAISRITLHLPYCKPCTVGRLRARLCVHTVYVDVLLCSQEFLPPSTPRSKHSVTYQPVKHSTDYKTTTKQSSFETLSSEHSQRIETRSKNL